MGRRIFTKYVFLIQSTCGKEYMHAVACGGRSEDNLQKPAPSFKSCELQGWNSGHQAQWQSAITR